MAVATLAAQDLRLGVPAGTAEFTNYRRQGR